MRACSAPSSSGPVPSLGPSAASIRTAARSARRCAAESRSLSGRDEVLMARANARTASARETSGYDDDTFLNARGVLRSIASERARLMRRGE